MIKQYNGAKAEKTSVSKPLPAGGYVARIMGADVVSYDWGDQLVISIDVAEGEYKEHFAKDYRSNTNEDKKWKGLYRIRIPDEDNQYFASQQRSFNNLIYALEASNSGYHFDWDEKKLKNKMIGVLYRDKEWEYEGKTGWTTECCAVLDVDAIRAGDFKMPKAKPLANKPVMSGNGVPMLQNFANAGMPSYEEVTGDDDLPF
jgi:hypothetical protein